MMRGSTIHLCYFPTSVFFVDDNRAFLTNVISYVYKTIPFQLFTAPEAALDVIKGQSTCLFERPLDKMKGDDDGISPSLDINFSDNVYNTQRFSHVSVVVVDYEMPGIDGIDFCTALRNSPVKKIMLTGEADNKVAVKAFNEGLIDKFMLKDAADMKQSLSRAIADLQARYFTEQLAVFERALQNKAFIPYFDATFRAFFNAICQDHCITEYYSFGTQRGFLLLDGEGNAYWLLVLHEKTIAVYEDIAADGDAPAAAIAAMRSREKAPFILTEDDEDFTREEWDSVLYPIQRIPGSAYYSALIDDNQVKKLNKQTIRSFQQFQTEHRLVL